MLESGVQRPRGLLVRLAGRNVVRRRALPQTAARYVASGDPDTHWFHGQVLGGLSNYWTGAVPRFAPGDFVDGVRLGEQFRWPIGYEDLRPHYEWAERLIGVSGSTDGFSTLPASIVNHRRTLPADWRSVAAVAASRGRYLTPMPLADGRSWLIRRSGTAFNSYSRIVAPLLGKPNFRFVRGAHALHLEVDRVSGRVRSVIYHDRMRNCEQRLDGTAIILAAGPIASTKLLLDSCSPAFPDGLGNSQGILGKYLHDHVHDMCIVESERPLSRLADAAYLTRARYESSEPLLATQAAIASNTALRDKLLNFTPLPAGRFGVIIFGSMVPTENNWVAPDAAAKDEFGLPALNIRLSFRDAELAHAAGAKDEAVALLNDAGYRARMTWSLPKVTPGTSVHFGGTARMHDSPRYGVVDGWNRLYDAPNVLAVDASCFTTGVEKNPALTSMAIASRAACRLADDLMRRADGCRRTSPAILSVPR